MENPSQQVQNGISILKKNIRFESAENARSNEQSHVVSWPQTDFQNVVTFSYKIFNHFSLQFWIYTHNVWPT